MNAGLPLMTKYPSFQWMASLRRCLRRKDFVPAVLRRGPSHPREKKNGEEKKAVKHREATMRRSSKALQRAKVTGILRTGVGEKGGETFSAKHGGRFLLDSDHRQSMATLEEASPGASAWRWSVPAVFDPRRTISARP